jgi:hypothetical protein
MNLFASLVDRAFGRAPVLQRRRPALFEPARNVMTTTRDSTGDSLREEQSYAEAESPAPRAMSKIVNGSDESRVESQTERSNVTAKVTPRATDITIVEEQPAFKASVPEANERADGQHDSANREQNLTQESRQQPAKPATTPSVAPSLETIVEAKPGPQIALQKPGDENPIEQVDLTADAPEDVQSSIVNNIVVLRSIAQKQDSEQIDESRLLKPVTQRRPTRQQMQRSAHARSQPAHNQLEAPATPTINVTIGRVEVRASAPARRAESARSAGPKLSLEEYLRGRSKGTK